MSCGCFGHETSDMNAACCVRQDAKCCHGFGCPGCLGLTLHVVNAPTCTRAAANVGQPSWHAPCSVAGCFTGHDMQQRLTCSQQGRSANDSELALLYTCAYASEVFALVWTSSCCAACCSGPRRCCSGSHPALAMALWVQLYCRGADLPQHCYVQRK